MLIEIHFLDNTTSQCAWHGRGSCRALTGIDADGGRRGSLKGTVDFSLAAIAHLVRVSGKIRCDWSSSQCCSRVRVGLRLTTAGI